MWSDRIRLGSGVIQLIKSVTRTATTRQTNAGFKKVGMITKMDFMVCHAPKILGVIPFGASFYSNQYRPLSITATGYYNAGK